MSRKTPQSNTDHDAVVDDWRKNVERHDEENYEFLRSMKVLDYGFEPDEVAGELHQQAFQIVDCTRYANCCKTLDIKFSDEDVERIAAHLNVPGLLCSDAAAKVLAGSKEAMNCKELIETMASRGLWTSPGGKTPHATPYSAILREINVKGRDARFKKTERGTAICQAM